MIRDRNNSHPEHTIQKRRLHALTILVFICFAIITFRLFTIQVVYHDKYVAAAKKQQWVSKKVPAVRGKILVEEPDGTNYPVALNESKGYVYVVPPHVKDQELVASELSAILAQDKKEILDKISNKKNYYVLLKRKLTEEEVEKIAKTGLDGVNIEYEDWRYYPENSLGSHVIGYVDAEGKGNYGIEGYYNEELSGKSGKIVLQTDAARKIQILGNNTSVGEVQEGADVVLTIDRVVQQKAERILKETVDKYSAKGGQILVADPKTNKILAMASNPDYNLNEYSKADIASFKNGAVQSVWEPGSILKTVTMAVGIDSGAIQPDTTFNETGSVTVGGHTIKNSDGKAHGIVSMTYVLQESLNVGVVWVVEQMDKTYKKFHEYLDKFGFGTKTGIELEGEVSGNLKSYEEAGKGDIARMSFGQAIAMTPIQAITAITAIANGGTLYKPYLVKEIINPDGEIIKNDPKAVRQVISKEAASKTGAMMVAVIEKGHGKQAKVPGYNFAGKTGTAQVPLENGKGYDANRNIGSFVMFGPVEDPRFVILVKIDEPKGLPFAESSAAPAAGKLAKELVTYYQIPPTK